MHRHISQPVLITLASFEGHVCTYLHVSNVSAVGCLTVEIICGFSHKYKAISLIKVAHCGNECQPSLLAELQTREPGL